MESLSANNIIRALDDLIALHKTMNVIAKQKTEIVKEGNIDGLRKVMKDEKKLIQAINKSESNLRLEAASFLQEYGIADEPQTLGQVLELALEADKELILRAKASLENEIIELSKQNRLNQELLEQSLQFVNMSIDLLQPDIESYNYDRSEGDQQENSKQIRSVFDSKA